MSIANFYPQELVNDASFSYEDVSLTTEEITSIADAEIAQGDDGLDEIDRVLRAAESAEKITDVVNRAVDEDAELGDASITAINASFESIAAACEYPIVPSIDGNDIKMSCEGVTDTVKDFAKNVYKATLELFAKIGEIFKKAMNWIKDKAGVYERKIKGLEEKIKSAPNKPTKDVFTMSSIPMQAVYVAALEDKPLVSGEKISVSQLFSSVEIMSKLADAVVPTLKGITVPDKVAAVNLEKPLVDPNSGTMAAVSARFKNAPSGYTVVAIRKKAVTVAGVKDNDIDIKNLEADTFKSVNDTLEKAQKDGKYNVEPTDLGSIKSLVGGAKTAIAEYKKSSADASKKVSDLTKSIKSISAEVIKDNKEDKEAAKKAKTYFKQARSVVRLLPRSVMMYIDVTNMGLDLAGAALTAYDGKADKKEDEGNKSE